LSNVPLAESLMVDVQGDALPPRWTPGEEFGESTFAARRERQEAVPWLWLLLTAALAATLVEAVWYAGVRLRGRLRGGAT